MFVPDGRREVDEHGQRQSACEVLEAAITILIMFDVGSGTTEETAQN